MADNPDDENAEKAKPNALEGSFGRALDEAGFRPLGKRRVVLGQRVDRKPLRRSESKHGADRKGRGATTDPGMEISDEDPPLACSKTLLSRGEAVRRLGLRDYADRGYCPRGTIIRPHYGIGGVRSKLGSREIS